MSSPPVYVISGASRSLGLGVARTLLDRVPNAHVVATARTPDSANLLKDLKAKYQDRLHIVKMDVVNAASTEAAARQVGDMFPDGIDTLIVNAGVAGGGFTGYEGAENLKTLKENMDTNVYGAMNTTNAFLPLIKKKEQGKRQIFFVSSSMGSLTGEMSQVPFGITYSMSKAALNMYVVKLAAQFKDEGLTIVSTHPGYVKSDMNNGEDGAAEISVEESVTKTVDNILLKADKSWNGTFYNWTGTVHPW